MLKSLIWGKEFRVWGAEFRGYHLSGAHDPRVIRSDVLGDRETWFMV